jgi:hypothetical protein
MANPLGTEFLSVPLRNFSVAQMQASANFVARRTLTTIPVAQQSAPYYVYPNSDWLRPEAQPLGRGAESAGGGWHLSSDNYNAKVYAIHKDNDAQDYANANAAQIMNLDQDATAYTTEQLQILEDTMFRDTFMPEAGGVWTTEYAGVASAPSATQFIQWTATTSKPVDDIANASILMARRNLGRRPNILYLPPTVYQALRRNAQIIELYQFTQGGLVTDSMLANALGVDRIEVLWSLSNTGKEGLADNINFIFGDTALLAYFSPTGGPKTNTAGAMFTWTAMDGGSAIGSRIDRIPMPWIHSIRIEGMAAFDMKVVNSAAGILFTNCTA